MAQLPDSGHELYEIGCAKCHGSDGQDVDLSLVGFSVPLPDFTDCRFASREARASDDWIAVTYSGAERRSVVVGVVKGVGAEFEVNSARYHSPQQKGGAHLPAILPLGPPLRGHIPGLFGVRRNTHPLPL
jgi:hypothetical protein